MGKIYSQIDDQLAGFIKKQKMFFVATAPRADNGHVNLSPKGCDGSFAILNPLNVAYVDRVGSGWRRPSPARPAIPQHSMA